MADNLDINNVHRELARLPNFIVFAGTGLVAGTGISDSWKKLMQALAEEVGVGIGGKSEDEYPDVAEDVYEKLRSEGKGQRYDDIIKEALTPTEIRWSPHAMEVIETTNWIVTTNFDNIIEASIFKRDAIKQRTSNPRIINLPNLEKVDGFDRETLTYLHGSAHNNYIILRRQQYDNYYPSVSGKNGPTCIEEYLEFIYRNYPIVFVGFSFRDRYVRACFANIHARMAWQDEDASRQVGYQRVLPNIPQHYALIRRLRPEDYSKRENYDADCETYKKIQQDLKAININFIWYHNHIEWTQSFEKIRELRETFTIVSLE